MTSSATGPAHPTTLPAPFSSPGSLEYAEATTAYQLATPVEPAGAFTARSVNDVVRAVTTAHRAGTPLQVSTTGHAIGRSAPLNGSLLLRPLIEAPVRVDPQTRTARVPAGKTWGDVLPEVVRHGLTALHGSSPTVGVIGYLLGGGISFYGRHFGLAANLVRSLTIVLADGAVVQTSATQHPELFWALRGGGGGLGVVVEAEIDLIPMHAVVTGMAVWDAADAARLAPLWQAWARTAPPQISTSLRMLSLPPLPSLPPALAGRRVLALDGAVTATTEADLPAALRIAEELLAPMAAVTAPRLNTWAPAPPQALPATHMDPPQPVAFHSDSALVDELDEAGWAKLLDAAPGLLALELRQLGGALSTPAPGGGALNHFSAPSHYYAVGRAGVLGVDTVAQLRAARTALQPSLTRFTSPNFVDSVEQPQRSYDEGTRVRVERVRLEVDPEGLFAHDVAPIRGWPPPTLRDHHRGGTVTVTTTHTTEPDRGTVSDLDEMNRRTIEEFRAHEGRVGGPFTGTPMVLVHHTGRKSGREFITPMMCLPVDGADDAVYVFASNGGAPTNPNWYYNLTSHGAVSVEWGTRTFPVSVRELTGLERDEVYAEQARRFPGFTGYARQTEGVRTIPVLELMRANR
jgi:deazaflavin-dependent oxidoreductase (nitroreductase family)